MNSNYINYVHRSVLASPVRRRWKIYKSKSNDPRAPYVGWLWDGREKYLVFGDSNAVIYHYFRAILDAND